MAKLYFKKPETPFVKSKIARRDKVIKLIKNVLFVSSLALNIAFISGLL